MSLFDREPSLQSAGLVRRNSELKHDLASIMPEPTNSSRWKVGAALAGVVLVVVGLEYFAPKSARADEGQLTVDQSRVVRTYRQCGGEGYSPNHTVFVQQVRNPDGFNTTDIGLKGGECGNRWTSPDSFVMTLEAAQYQDTHSRLTPGVPLNGRFFYSRSYPQCGGSVGAMDFRPNNTILVDAYEDPKSGEKTHTWRDVGPQPGQCSNP